MNDPIAGLRALAQKTNARQVATQRHWAFMDLFAEVLADEYEKLTNALVEVTYQEVADRIYSALGDQTLSRQQIQKLAWEFELDPKQMFNSVFLDHLIHEAIAAVVPASDQAHG